MAITFDTESEARAVAVEFNAAAGRDVRYQAERYREKWAIARQSKRTYWGWDEFVIAPPKSAPGEDVETVRQVVDLALRDGMEIAALIALIQTQNEGEINAKLSEAKAGQAGIIVRNALFARLVLMVTREFASPSRKGDLHVGRAFELLNGETLAIFQGVGVPAEIAMATEKWQRLRADQRLQSLSHFRDKETAHLGITKDDIPAVTYKDLFGLAEETIDLIDHLAAGTTKARVKIRDNIDAKPAAEAFWKPWSS